MFQLAAQLSEVLHTLIPKRIAESLRRVPSKKRQPEHMAYWTKQPQVKCIIAIRDDKLASLDLLKSYMPLILRNRYKLYPLKQHNAAEAMAEPAADEKGDYTVRPFSFAPDTLKQILELLAGKKTDEPGTAQTKR